MAGLGGAPAGEVFAAQLGERRHQQAGVVGEHPDVADAGALDMRQAFGDAVEIGLAADQSDIGMLLGLPDQVLARADGMGLVLNRPLADPVGFRFDQNSVTMRLVDGELTAGTIAPAVGDGVERLWQFREVGHYPVYAIYGMDAVLIRAAWLRQIVPFGLVTLLASALTYGMSRRWQAAVEGSRRAQNEAEVARIRAERAEALARVEQARDDLVQLIERSNDFVGTADLDGRITYMNAAAKRMIGLDRDRDLHFSGFIGAIAVQSDGKIVAAGSAAITNTNDYFLLARFNADGSLDTSFGVGGFDEFAIDVVVEGAELAAQFGRKFRAKR